MRTRTRAAGTAGVLEAGGAAQRTSAACARPLLASAWAASSPQASPAHPGQDRSKEGDSTEAWLRQRPPRKAVFEQRIIQHIHATHMGAGNRESFTTGAYVTKRKNRTGRNGEQAGEMKGVGGAGARPTPRTGRWHLGGRLMTHPRMAPWTGLQNLLTLRAWGHPDLATPKQRWQTDTSYHGKGKGSMC